MDWFLYDNGLRHERVKYPHLKDVKISSVQFCYGSSDVFGVIYECLEWRESLSKDSKIQFSKTCLHDSPSSRLRIMKHKFIRRVESEVTVLVPVELPYIY